MLKRAHDSVLRVFLDLKMSCIISKKYVEKDTEQIILKTKYALNREM